MSLLLLEQDLAQLPMPVIQELCDNCHRLIVLEHSQSRLSELADIVLPVACVSESAGHFANYQGLMQAFYPAHNVSKPILSNWQWLNFLAKILFGKTGINTTSINKQMSTKNKFDFTSLNDLHHYFSNHGEAWAVQILQKLSLQGHEEKTNATTKVTDVVAQQTHRVSGRTAQFSNVTMHEPQALKSQDNYLNFSMENNSVLTAYEQPFTWSPSWNSNEAILQAQQQVNDELSCVPNENHLTFIFNDHLEEQITRLWPTIPKSKAILFEEIIFIQNLPWFLVDMQARLLPEFILMFTGNEIQISADLAEKNHWKDKQVLEIEVQGIRACGVININDDLSNNVVLASLFELPSVVNNIHLNIKQMRLASDDEVMQFHQAQSERYQKAKEDQQSILARLKNNDQHIPITLCSSSYIGGKQKD